MEKRLSVVIGDLAKTSAMVNQIERTAKAMHKAAIPGICIVGNWDGTHRLYKLAMCQLANAAIESLMGDEQRESYSRSRLITAYNDEIS